MGPARRPSKNPHAEADQFRRRAALGFRGVLVCLLGLGGWYFKLQGLDHDVYATRSEANRIKPRPVVPGRGTIYDRNGRLLAENVPAFRLDVTPDKAGDLDALLAALRAEGCRVVGEREDSEYGKFGWVLDPDGNKVELWEPPAG